MKEQGGGSIVGVSSVQGKIAIPYRSACKYKLVHTIFSAPELKAQLSELF